MTRESLVFISGAFVLAIPYIGIPDDYKKIALAFLGGILIVLGYSLRRSAFFRSIDTGMGEHRSEAFAENNVSDREERRSDGV